MEVTTPTVTNVAVSRGGNSSDLSKAYATTTTNTIYFCYDSNVAPTDCNNSDPWIGGNTAGASSVPFLAGTCTNLGPPVQAVEQNARAAS